MGTLALLQEGNTRTDLNITDIRYAHTKLGRLLSNQFAEFGFGDRARRFGLDAKYIQAALEGIRNKSLNLPVYASTASVNREVEKQADLMLSGVMQKHHQMIGQMMQAASNQFTPPEMKKYIAEAIEASNLLMRMVFKHFGYDEVERFVPDVTVQAQPTNGPGQPQLPPGQGQPGQGGMGPGGTQDALPLMIQMMQNKVQ